MKQDAAPILAYAEPNLDQSVIVEAVEPIDLPPANYRVAPETEALPVTSAPSIIERQDSAQFNQFVRQMSNGNAAAIVGIYVPNTTSFSVLQQPAGNAGYVSTQDGALTQFALASDYGSIGMLAHNYLAGSDFFQMSEGIEILLVYGDGRAVSYIIEDIHDYQALNPTSPYSEFIDLENGARLTSTDLFYSTYGLTDSLVLQTCIAQDAESSWGRRFIIARPVGEYLFTNATSTEFAPGISYERFPQAKFDLLEKTS